MIRRFDSQEEKKKVLQDMSDASFAKKKEIYESMDQPNLWSKIEQ